MLDPNLVLGIAPGASLEEVRSAYYQRRANLLSQEGGETDPVIAAQLQDLDIAYQALTDRFKPAPIVQQPRQQGTDNPLLNMVDGIDAPIQVHANAGGTIVCPHCGAPNPERAMMCLNCKQQMGAPCPNCGEPVLFGQNSCARCGAVPVELYKARMAESEISLMRRTEDRHNSELYVDRLEKHHAEGRRFGWLFWSVVVIVLTVLCGLMLAMPVILGWMAQR